MSWFVLVGLDMLLGLIVVIVSMVNVGVFPKVTLFPLLEILICVSVTSRDVSFSVKCKGF